MQILIWRKAAGRNALEDPGCFKECEGRSREDQEHSEGGSSMEASSSL